MLFRLNPDAKETDAVSGAENVFNKRRILTDRQYTTIVYLCTLFSRIRVRAYVAFCRSTHPARLNDKSDTDLYISQQLYIYHYIIYHTL